MALECFSEFETASRMRWNIFKTCLGRTMLVPNIDALGEDVPAPVEELDVVPVPVPPCGREEQM